MSAFCLGLAGPVSAPPELDSACRMEQPQAAAAAAASGAKDTRSPASPAAAPAASPAASAGGSGALELALEEEMALLAAAGESEAAEPESEPPQGPAVAEPELLSLMRQKEKDLMLAARLGKALLERNQDMSRQYEKMHKELTDKLEVRPPPGRGKRKRTLLEGMTQVYLGPQALPSRARCASRLCAGPTAFWKGPYLGRRDQDREGL